MNREDIVEKWGEKRKNVMKSMNWKVGKDFSKFYNLKNQYWLEGLKYNISRRVHHLKQNIINKYENEIIDKILHWEPELLSVELLRNKLNKFIQMYPLEPKYFNKIVNSILEEIGPKIKFSINGNEEINKFCLLLLVHKSFSNFKNFGQNFICFSN